MVTMKFTVFVIFVAAHFPNIEASDDSLIGKGIDLRTYNLLGPVAESGAVIYSELGKSCVQTQDSAQSFSTFSYYKDTSTFYKKVGSNAGIQASLQSDVTLGFTLDATTDSVSGESRTVTGNSMQILATTSKDILQTDCAYNTALNPQLIADLQGLPTAIKSPEKSSSWYAYELFFERYGTHVVSGIIYGSSVDQNAFAEASSSYSQRDFEVKSCMSLMGPTEAGMANLSLCAGVSQEDINTVSHYSMTEKLIVNGGTPETRDQIASKKNITVDNLYQFMTEANTTRAPIFHAFKPIWEIIQGHGNSTNQDLIRGVNMEQYYTGYLSYGCTYSTVGSLALQKFGLSPLSSPSVPKYECTLAHQGCHNDDDCHYRLVKCKCQDHTCVRYRYSELDTGDKKTEAYINHQDKWYWNGCGWKVAGSKCECKTKGDSGRTVVWSGDNKAMVGVNRGSMFGSKSQQRRSDEL